MPLDWEAIKVKVSTQQGVIIMGYGPHSLHLTREEQLLNIQNKILASKTSILC